MTDANQPLGGDGPVWIRVGTLIDGTSKVARHDAHVVYDRERIRFVGVGGDTPPRDVLKPEQSSPDVELPNHTLLPGLCDAHTHVFLDGAELDVEKRAAHLALSRSELLPGARERLTRILEYGVVAVRDAGDRHGVGLVLSAECRAANEQGMAHIDSPGAGIHRTGRYGAFMGDAIDAFDSPEACVESRIAQGADRIKIIATGVVDFERGTVSSQPQFSADEIRRIVQAAKHAGRQTFAHASGDAGIDNCIAGGVDSIEHGYFVRDDQLARMRDEGIAWVPTFAPVREQLAHADRLGWGATARANIERILDGHAESVVKAYHLGVRVLAGSDSGSYGVALGAGLRHELELLEGAGLPVITVLNAATGRSESRLNFNGSGRLATGYRARFLLSAKAVASATRNLDGATLIFDGRVIETI